MGEKDFKPSYLELSLTYLKQFIVEFFDQNPISQIGIVVSRNGLAEVLSELSGE